MADYITKIRTADGDKQIDYNALANLPIVGSDLKWYKVLDFTSGEEVIELNIPLSNEAISCLNSKKKWIIEIIMDVSGSTNTETSLGSLDVSFFRTWRIVMFSRVDSIVPTNGINYASPAYVKLVYEKMQAWNALGVDVMHTFFGIKNYNNTLARMEARYQGGFELKTGDTLKLTGSINIPAGTKVVMYATDEREVVEL